MPNDTPWVVGVQRNISGQGRPGSSSSSPGATVGWLWEEPQDIAQGHVIVRLILGNPNASAAPWAGANIYLSNEEEGSYALLASISQRSIIGESDNLLAASTAGWQAAETVDVVIDASPGTLVATDQAGAVAGVNLCLLGDEIISFADASLIAANTYRLTGLVRGWYGTAAVEHAAASRFAMLSPLQARVDMPISAKGQTWYWKAASLNIGRVEQSLDEVTADTITLAGSGMGATLLNTGLRLLDTNASHHLTIKPGSDLTADRTLTVTTGDATRTITLSGNPTLDDWFDQAVKTTSNPGFASVTVGNSGLHVLDTDASHDLILTPGSNLSADRILTITTGDAARLFSLLGALYVEAESRVNQDLTTDSATAQFAALNLGTGSLNTVGSIIYRGNATRYYRADTADGSDIGRLDICGGGESGSTRGASVVLFGNEGPAGFQGTCYIWTGAPGTTGAYDGKVVFDIGGAISAEFDRSGNFILLGTGTRNIGSAANYPGDISYKTLTDRGCLGSFDAGVEMPDGSILSDMAALQAIQVDPAKETVYGVPRLDYASMPQAVYKPAPIATGDVYEPVGMPEAGKEPEMILRWRKGEKMGDDGAELTALISVMLGAIKELNARVDALSPKVPIH